MLTSNTAFDALQMHAATNPMDVLAKAAGIEP